MEKNLYLMALTLNKKGLGKYYIDYDENEVKMYPLVFTGYNLPDFGDSYDLVGNIEQIPNHDFIDVVEEKISNLLEENTSDEFQYYLVKSDESKIKIVNRYRPLKSVKKRTLSL